MSLELRDVPPAPRRPRWPVALVVGWPLLLIGGFLVIYGGLFTLMFFFAAHADAPRIEVALDESAALATGTVTRVWPLGEAATATRQDRVSFRFRTPEGQSFEGECLVSHGRFEAGSETVVEYLPADPRGARVRGGHVSRVTGFVRPAFWMTVVPGLVLLLLWWIGVIRTRRLLATGDAAVAHVLRVEHVRRVVPCMLRVRFRFRDRHAGTRDGRQWVRERSKLGERLLDGDDRLVLIHDRQRPNRHRLATSDDFVPAPSTADELPTKAERSW